MPASSNVVEFTITFGSRESGSCGKTWRRACWLNLEAHPAQDESEVSLRTSSRGMCSHLLLHCLSFRAKSRKPDQLAFDTATGSFDFDSLRMTTETWRRG